MDQEQEVGLGGIPAQGRRGLGYSESKKRRGLGAALDFVRGGLMGVTTDVAGYPVDLATMAMRPFGYSVPDKEVVGSSDWMANKLGVLGGGGAEMAGRVASGFLTPGPMDFSRLGDLAMAGMTAYHGSPHKFDKFDSSKIGTGEGAQAYGHGLYFAENPDVAKGYQRNLTPTNVQAGTIEEAAIMKVRGQGGRDEALRFMDDNFSKELAEAGDNYYKQLRKAIKKVEIPQGHLYNVDIPDEHISKMLDWDAPLSEQPEHIRKALADIDLGPVELRDGMPLAGGGKLRINAKPPHPYALEMGGGLYSLTEADVRRLVGDGQAGMSLYQKLSSKLGGDAKASEYLKSLGIPGIRYLDAGSRTSGKGTRNFVVFDDSILKILKRE